MTGPDDTLPPESGVTLPSPPPSSSAGELPIVHGEAQFAVSQAMNTLVRAVIGIEKTAMALARQLDETGKEPTT